MSTRLRNHVRGHLIGYLALFVALGGSAYAVDRVTSRDIAKNAILSKHILRDQVRRSDIKEGTINGSHFEPGAIGGSALTDRAISDAKLDYNAVTAQKIADDNVYDRHLAAGAVGNSELSGNSVGNDEMRDDAVTGVEVVNGSLDHADVGDESLSGAEIRDNHLTGDDIAEPTLGEVPRAADAGSVDGAEVEPFVYRSNATNASTTLVSDLAGLTITASCPAGDLNASAQTAVNNSTLHSASSDAVNGDLDNELSVNDFDAGVPFLFVGPATDVSQVGSTQYSRPGTLLGTPSRAVSVQWQAHTNAPGAACLLSGVAIGG